MSAVDDRTELAQLQEEWMASMQRRDIDGLERLVAPGFRFTAVHLDPEPMSRDQWMDAAREGYTIVSFTYETMEIDVFGDTAVVHARYSQVATSEDANLSNLFRVTDVWSRRQGRWQVVARHSSVLA